VKILRYEWHPRMVMQIIETPSFKWQADQPHDPTDRLTSPHASADISIRLSTPPRILRTKRIALTTSHRLERPVETCVPPTSAMHRSSGGRRCWNAHYPSVRAHEQPHDPLRMVFGCNYGALMTLCCLPLCLGRPRIILGELRLIAPNALTAIGFSPNSGPTTHS
jgi:hypothetical protein